MNAVLMPACAPCPLSQATNCPAMMLSTTVMSTARSTGTTTVGNSPGSSARPKLRKKNAPNTSRSGMAICSMRLRTRVAPRTSPMRKAPIASVTPSTSPMPPKRIASPKNRTVNSSTSRVRMKRERNAPPLRATVNMTTRKANDTASWPTTAHGSVWPLSTTDTMAR